MEVEELKPESKIQFPCSSAVFIQPHSTHVPNRLIAHCTAFACTEDIYKLAKPEVPSWLSTCIFSANGRGEELLTGKERGI